MKKSAFLLFILFISTSSLSCQLTKDSLKDNSIYSKSYDKMSPEESWEIHKEAYVKQLKSKGLTANEIENKMAIYENQKMEFIKNMTKQRKLAAIQKKEVEKLRDEAEIQRKQADILRKKAEILREQAEEQRKKADILRTEAEESRDQNALQREYAEELRKQARTQRQNAEILRAQAEIQRKKADILRTEAEVQRKKAEEWRKSYKTVFTKEVTISSQSMNSQPIIIKIDKKNPLLFSINARISSGTTLIEIINPNGEKKGELSLEYVKKSNVIEDEAFLKSIAGSLNKTISDAEVGNWQIKISSQKSKGAVSISVAQYIKPTMDE